MFYEVLMEKRAKRDNNEDGEERGRGAKKVLALSGVLGGKKALDSSAPLVTGRRTLYHGTTKDVADKIRANGLTPALARSASGEITSRGGNITDLVQPVDFLGRAQPGFANFDTAEQRDAYFDAVERLRSATDSDEIERIKKEFPRGKGAKGSVYLDPRPTQANLYANQQATIARGDVNNLQDVQAYQQKQGLNPFKAMFSLDDGADIVKARVPYDLERRMIENPEIAYHEDVTLKNPMVFGAQKRNIELSNRALRDTYVLPGELGPEYIVGSDKFKRHSLAELKDYAMNNKGRFAKGLGLAGVGLAGVGLGGRELYRQFKTRKQNKEQRR
jgi:hypothetical protein